MNTSSLVRKYGSLKWYERRLIRRQLAQEHHPLRIQAFAWLNRRYSEYREAGGDLFALAWAQQVLPADIWNALFSANMGSYGAPTVLLENRGGQYRAIYKK
jgi:hypothetical protein